MNFVTQARLDTANYQVTGELDCLGFYDKPMQEVDTYLVMFSDAYGYHHYGESGNICIPRVSLSKIQDIISGEYTSLRDVLRHEFAHALADTHRGLIRSRHFTNAFGAPHNWENRQEYDPDYHVSAYAATAPAEDFAEVFMHYVKTGGNLPRKWRKSGIMKKWLFVRELGNAVRRGRRNLD
jgi:hypothetical protein